MSLIPVNCLLVLDMKGLEMSQCALFHLILPTWSWKESVCVATLLVALILAVLSILYGDVLLYLWLFCLCLGCTGDVLLGSMVNSSSSALHGNLSSVHQGLWAARFSWAPWWTLLFCAPWRSLLCPWGSPWAAEGCLGCLSTGSLASVLLGLDLFGCAGLPCCGSFSLSTADFLSEMKLKASFSAV